MKDRQLPIRALLLLLALGASLPLVLFSVYIVTQLGLFQQDSLATSLAQRGEAAANAVEQRLNTVAAALATLSVGRAARTNDIPIMYEVAQHLLLQYPEASAIALVGRNGEMIFNTQVPLGKPLPPTDAPLSLQRVFKTGHPSVSSPFTGPFTKEWVIAVDVPIIVYGKIFSCLRMIVRAEKLVETLQAQQLPEDWEATLADPNGTIVASTRQPDADIGHKVSPVVQDALAVNRHGVFDTVTLDGVAIKTVIATVPSWGWAVALGVPASTMRRPLVESLWKISVGGAILLAAGVGLAILLSRHLAQQVSMLSAAATALATGNTPQVFLTGIRELNDAAAALAMARDREKEVVTALAVNRHLLQDVIDASTSIIYAFDQEGHCLLVNQACCILFGKPAEQLIGRDRLTFLPKEIADVHRANDLAVLASGQPISLEETNPESDGLHTYLSIKFPIEGADGHFYAVGGISTDITDRKRVEAELERYRQGLETLVTERTRELEAALAGIRQSEERFRLLFNSSNDVVLVNGYNPQTGEPMGCFIEVNDAACRRLGYSRDELLRMGPADLDDPSTPTLDDKLRSLATRKSAVFERLHVAKNGRRIPVEINVRTFVYHGMPLFLAIVRDITERKTLEEELKRSNAELEQFAYIASHDLRQPLRIVNSYLTLIERRYGDRFDEDGIEFIGYARDGAIKMDKLILDLLEYSRVGRHGDVTASVNLADMAAEARGNLEALIDDTGCTLAVETATARVMGNPTEVMRLFQNLIGNAIKYHAPDRPPVVEVGWRADGGDWVVWVRDNGIGIPPDQRDRVFGIFQRLNSATKYEGTGIGLAISKKIVERHGGRIWIESGEGTGSKFLFSLPKVAEKEAV